MTLSVEWLNVDVETCDVVSMAAEALDAGVEAESTVLGPVEEVMAVSVEVDKLPPDNCVSDLLESSDEGSEGEVVPVELKEPSGEELVDVERPDLGTSNAEVLWFGPGRVEVTGCVVSCELIDVDVLWKTGDDWALVLSEIAEEGLFEMTRVTLPDVEDFVLIPEIIELRTSIVEPVCDAA